MTWLPDLKQCVVGLLFMAAGTIRGRTILQIIIAIAILSAGFIAMDYFFVVRS